MQQKWCSKEQFEDLLLDTEVWAYTIMGSKEAQAIWYDLIDILLSKMTPKELSRPSGQFSPDLINNRAIDDLSKYIQSKNSRLAYFVLGVLIMKYGAKISSKLRKLLLEYSRWEYEEHQFTSESVKQERKKYLLDFRYRVQNYKESQPIRVPVVFLSDLIEKKFLTRDYTLIECYKIDYRINKNL